ncbi:hypothetical protein Aeqsu_2428 [Aequorivita sublithincola DSM 14238]|uniref:Uncharacterized protein n=1 Tax=Aequorivita sublithincola (strain DSM 14238 / LMG 21431 / ACAM 643 / 9-3) TaxID=746697 RepID=I3YY18_AEQSU|nr:hypothetical protein [Aequorivita sublithincola]AFL81886.1 hypothetical protein Aeqsu_2428 [Aequorivita sublithincola DSM 14238]
MNRTFYRVGIYNENDILLNSKTYNYGRSFGKEYDHLMQSYFSIADKIDLPIDFLIYINDETAKDGDVFLSKVKLAIVNEFYIDLFKVTANAKHKGIVIPIG